MTTALSQSVTFMALEDRVDTLENNTIDQTVFYATVGNGTDDQTADLNSVFAEVAASGGRAMLSGTYNFTSAILIPNSNNIAIEGTPGTILRYTGASATSDLITFGDGSALTGLEMTGIAIQSNTTMTAGAALRIRRTSHVRLDIIMQDGEIYDGVWLDNSSLIYMGTSRIQTSHRCVVWNGSASAIAVELHMQSAYIVGVGSAGTGIHIAGGCGGYYDENLTQIGNDIGLKIDTTATGTQNYQIFLEDAATYDGNVTASVYVDDALGAGATKLLSVNAWLATNSAGSSLVVKNWPSAHIIVGTGKLLNNTGNGIDIQDVTCKLRVSEAAYIKDNTGYAITANATFTCTCNATMTNNNGGGVNFNSSVLLTSARYGQHTITVNPSDGWMLDSVGNALTIANGANSVMKGGSGVISINNPSDGATSLWLTGGGAAVLLGGTGSSWIATTTTPGAGKASVAYNGSNYAIYNNVGSSIAFNVAMLLRVRSSV